MSADAVRLGMLRNWRLYVKIIRDATIRVRPDAMVYVVGGAAEGRLTVLSDIDVVVTLPRRPGFEEATELRARIWDEAERMGLPINAPVELHIIGAEELAKYTKMGRVIKVEDI